jgi:hypothetical protein
MLEVGGKGGGGNKRRVEQDESNESESAAPIGHHRPFKLPTTLTEVRIHLAFKLPATADSWYSEERNGTWIYPDFSTHTAEARILPEELSPLHRLISYAL